MDKEFYKCCILVLNELTEKGALPEKDFKRIAGIYYKEVASELKRKDAAYNIGYGDYEEDANAKLLLETKYYERIIKEIEEEEYRIKLDNESKIATIKGTKIAKWAFWLSLLSLTGLVQDFLRLAFDFIMKTIENLV